MSTSFEASSNGSMQIFGLGCLCNDGHRLDNLVHLDSGNMNQLGRGWSKNHTGVSLRLIARGMIRLGGAAHWAWILESNELGEDDFFCSIEYGVQGIVIATFHEYDGIENACRGSHKLYSHYKGASKFIVILKIL